MTDFEGMIFDKEAAKRVLAGDVNALGDMCAWEKSPMGYDYWASEAERMKEGNGLTWDAQRQVEIWLEECEDISFHEEFNALKERVNILEQSIVDIIGGASCSDIRYTTGLNDDRCRELYELSVECLKNVHER